MWGTKLGFILAAVGSAIGLGNIWRFPYMTYSNGGGAFLIPYFTALILVGITVMMLELVLGHSTKGSAPLALKRLKAKGSEWIGWLGVMAGFVILTYYMIIIGWGAVYLLKILLGGFPTDFEGFFFNDILELSAGPGVLGGFSVSVLIAVVAVWLINFIIVNSGVKEGLEKTMKVFMPILFVLILALVIRGVTLVGGMEGIEWYLTPDFSKLTDVQIWIDACGQVFFSLSLGFGIMIAYSSYLPKKSDITRNAFIISLMDSGFSFLAGFAVFGTLGYMAVSKGVPFEEVVAQSIGLAFIVFPQALSLMPVGGEILAAVFFFCLIIAGISSSASLLESVTSSVMDKFNVSRRKAVVAVTICGLLCGLIYTTKGGLYWLDIVDYFFSKYMLLIVGILEVLVAIWICKGDKLVTYIDSRSELKIGKLWKYVVGIIAPLILLVILAQYTLTFLSEGYGGYEWIYLYLGLGVVALSFIVSFALPFLPWPKKVESWDEFVEKEQNDDESDMNGKQGKITKSDSGVDA
ncbi:sodium-dependent transporter [Methanooceanicella nereidis]|nr:sodium-dependent transporter [Methanocella sp. CWC-04]